MIFLSAQPDSPYFIWQLDLQIHNFSKLGILPQNIHVLIGYDPEAGINSRFLHFIHTTKHLASFYPYPDKRIKRKYIPSIRPHIIKQHFQKHPELSTKSIFYHDSDIVFTEKLPDFEKLMTGDTWYFSDARSYLDSGFIKRHGRIVFSEMCSIVGIDEKLVEENDDNAGGAQTLIKNSDFDFWNKIEEDCESLYTHLQKNRNRYEELYLKENPEYELKYTHLPSWCADMWALLWNGLMRSKVRISPELDFCWPYEDISLWKQKRIFHNAGVDASIANKFFYKGFFTKREPYEEDFSYISKDILSYKYAQLIEEVANKKRYDLKDVTFTITARIGSPDRLENLFTSLSFILKHFDTNILLLEADKERRIPANKLSPEVNYIFIKDDDAMYLRQKYNNYLLLKADTPFVIKYDLDIIVPPSQLNNAIISVRAGDSKVSYPYDGRFINVSGVLRSYFIKTLDIRLFSKYISYPHSTYPSYGGCVIVEKDAFLTMGIDNEAFNGWGFEDQEIPKRSKILGFPIKRQDGPLFHLDHQRGAHSYFYNATETLNSYKEYVKVCNMGKEELTHYISTWKRKLI